ncbi:MAG: DUF4397 domain-containing protein [Chloroflexi bacterium]|nr:DUF4397 domain-containing protein [Chloroflexota bacterium]
MRKFLTLLVVLIAVALTSISAFAQLEPPEPAPDAAFVRIAHLSPDTPAVKAFVNGTAAISGLQFGSVTRWLDLAPGTYEFAVGTGSDPAAAQIPAFSLDLAAGSFTTLAAVGNGDTLTGIAIPEDYTRISTGQARATVVHAIEGAGPVNFSVGGGSFEYINFPGAIASADGWDASEIAPGAGVTVTAFGSGATLLENADREIAANHNYLVAAIGSPDSPRLLVIDTDQAEFSTPNFAEGEARVRVAHFSASTPSVRIFVNGTVALSGLNYRFVTRYLPFQPGTYEIAVGPNSNIASAVIGPVDLTFEDGGFYTVAAIDDGDGGVTAVVLNDNTAVDEGAAVTVYHGIAGGPTVDVWAGDVKLVEGLAHAGSFLLPAGGFNDGISEVSAAAGSVTVAVTGAFAASPEDALLSREVEFAAGSYYLIAVIGTPDAPRLVVQEVDPAVDLED